MQENAHARTGMERKPRSRCRGPRPRSKARSGGNQKRCYIYTCVSTRMQMDGCSLDAQRDRLIYRFGLTIANALW